MSAEARRDAASRRAVGSRLALGAALVAWPALLVSEHLPLAGSQDDIATALLVPIVILGLLGIGWSFNPLWPALAAVSFVGVVAPLVIEAVKPSRCPAGATGIDCASNALDAVFVLPAVVLVLAVAGVKRLRDA